MPPLPLHDDPPPWRTHALAVGAGHLLHVQESGFPDGLPALVLHGGPGSGCSPLLRRPLDPARYRIVCPDQRGSGASRPRGETAQNTTDRLIDDLRLLRRHLGIARWLVVGGSWGATLALAYAAAEPQAITGLLLRAPFLARREDVQWFLHGAAALHPQAWRRFASVAPPQRRDALLPWLAEALAAPAGDESARRVAAAWWIWEQTLAHGAEPAAAPEGEALSALVDRYRVQSHYLRHDCWLAAPTLLERAEAVPAVPTLVLQGDADVICRPEGATLLQQRLRGSTLRCIPGAGHDPAHPAMAAAARAALDAFAARGDFGDAP